MSSDIKIPMLNPTYSGKVRDVYDLGDRLVIVATDRLSAFDVVFHEPIPDKGRILTKMSRFWFQEFVPFRSIVPNHCLSLDPRLFPLPFSEYVDELADRSMLVTKAARIDFECVVRGFIAGSAWKEYRAAGTVNGERLPPGLREADRLPEPIFTPATKAAVGHDENVSFAFMASDLGDELAGKLRDTSIALYTAAARHAESRGLLLADTKFEFGLTNDGGLMLIDEVLTPDSSRYWSAANYEPGHAQDQFDKQVVRDYLETLDWNKQPPPPPLPEDVIAATRAKYCEAYRMITGEEFR